MEDITKRFLTSIGITDLDYFDIEIVSCTKDSGRTNFYNFLISKLTPWTFKEYSLFVDKISNIKYGYEFKFYYEKSIRNGELIDFIKEFYLTRGITLDFDYNYDSKVLNISFKTNKERDDFNKHINDLDGILNFLNYDIELNVTSLEKVAVEEKVIEEPVKEEIKPEISVSEETIENEFNEVKGLNEEMLKSEIKNNYDLMILERKNRDAFKKGNYVPCLICQIDSNSESVDINGKLKKFESRDTRSGKLNVNFILDDGSSAINVVFYSNETNLRKDELLKLAGSQNVRVKGRIKIDQYRGNRLTVVGHFFYQLPDDEVREDKEPVKRIELHLHTKMSDMDGVSFFEDYVKTAKAMGHKAIAITDHGNVQGYPKAQATAKKYDMKVIYGSELYVIDEYLHAAVNANDTRLSDATYVCLDTETTGLSMKYDKITEFAAVKIKNGIIIDSMDVLINPEVDIPLAIQRKTNITNEMVKDKPTIKEVLPQILNFLEDSIIVTHNLEFDYGFINEALISNNYPKLNIPGIDTLNISRYLFPENAAHNLGAVCKRYEIEYDEKSAHRADYDTKVLSSVFLAMRNQLLTSNNYLKVSDLTNLLLPKRALKHYRNTYHAVALCKNLAGVKELYQIISDSHINNIGLYPYTTKTFLNSHRSNLLIGSACFNGEVFQAAMLKDDESLAKAISQFDYIEIQPLTNYSYLVNTGEVPDEERIKHIVLRIINEAKKQNKLIVATGDVHYCNPDDKIYRDVIINSESVGHNKHPLNHFVRFSSLTEEKADEICVSFASKEDPTKKIYLQFDTSDVNHRRNSEVFTAINKALHGEDPFTFFTTNSIERDALMKKQGIRLYAFYNEDLSDRRILIDFENPNQFYKTTTEMLEEMKWIGDDSFDYVVTNTNKINDMIEDKMIPVKLETYNPVIENSEKLLTDLVMNKAHELYGENIPQLIKDRIDVELNGIINHGYSALYYIAHKLVKKANDDGKIVGSRGSVGSSLVATLSDITEVNPLPPHYRCPKCKHVEFYEDNTISGFDLPTKACPHCGTKMISDGQSIPFQTFLGFHAEKTPDIDLNFATNYQATAHEYTKELGAGAVYRAGTIQAVQEKTARKLVIDYLKEVEHVNESDLNWAKIDSIVCGLVEIKRTTGQHPAGIVVVPNGYVVEDFTPIQYPSNDDTAAWKTTHFDFESMHDTLLKLDILAHLDPQSVEMMCNLTGVNIHDIPLNDPEAMSLFSSDEALHLSHKYMVSDIGTLGIPENGTEFVRRVLRDARPKNFTELVVVCGVTHGKEVWENNAENLIKNNHLTLRDVIGCRDDIMGYLIKHGLPPEESFKIMEAVRKKDKKPTPEQIADMHSHGVPDYYIDSCLKISYMFPKGHATAYATMAVRVAYFKVHYPLEYYATFFSLRSDDYDIFSMIGGLDEIHQKIVELEAKRDNKDADFSVKDSNILNTLYSAQEMCERGFKFANISVEKSMPNDFIIDYENKALIPPFKTIPGLGLANGNALVNARNEKPFTSREDFVARSGLTQTNIKFLDQLGCLSHLSEKEETQLSLFDFGL